MKCPKEHPNETTVDMEEKLIKKLGKSARTETFDDLIKRVNAFPPNEEVETNSESKRWAVHQSHR